RNRSQPLRIFFFGISGVGPQPFRAARPRVVTLPSASIAQRLCYGKPVMADLRLDKWLWAARFFKSRTLATAACDGGKVDVNEQAAKPSRGVRPGDLLHVTLPRAKKIVRVVALSDHRGPSAQAKL